MKKDTEKSIKLTGKILDLWLPRKIEYDEIPGISVGIVYGGKLMYKAGFGYADVEAKIKATPETCCRIASISKTFTSVAILQLAEQGKLDLDDQIEKYLPWFKVKGKSGDSKNITIRQLLSHTSGVFRDGVSAHWIDDKFPDEEELKKSISSKTVVFENLTQFKYSNFGFALLGQIIKKVSGMSYEDFVTANIINKLGLKNTQPDFTGKEILAQGYSRMISGEKRIIFPNSKTNAYVAATGFMSNVSDLAKYISALSVESSKNPILGRESKKEMRKDYWKTNDEGNTYGLGLEMYKLGDKKIIGHGGGFCGFITRVSLDVENDIGVIVLTNSIESNASEINRGILETIHTLINEANNQDSGKTIVEAEKYEGVYRSRWSDNVIVSVGGKLVSFDSRATSPLKWNLFLEPSGKDQFVIQAKDNFDSIGEIAKFIFGKKTSKAQKVMFGATPAERIA